MTNLYTSDIREKKKVGAEYPYLIFSLNSTPPLLVRQVLTEPHSSQFPQATLLMCVVGKGFRSVISDLKANLISFLPQSQVSGGILPQLQKVVRGSGIPAFLRELTESVFRVALKYALLPTNCWALPHGMFFLQRYTINKNCNKVRSRKQLVPGMKANK